jgi:hypothetical protein
VSQPAQTHHCTASLQVFAGSRMRRDHWISAAECAEECAEVWDINVQRPGSGGKDKLIPLLLSKLLIRPRTHPGRSSSPLRASVRYRHAGLDAAMHPYNKMQPLIGPQLNKNGARP